MCIGNKKKKKKKTIVENKNGRIPRREKCMRPITTTRGVRLR